MSWLKNAVSKVGEKAAALKESERFQKLQEKTTSVVAYTAEKVKSTRERIGRPANAIEFEAQLENKARTTLTLPGLTELHKSWAQGIAASANKEGPRVTMGEHELGFKEMFLQSRALELTLEVIVSDPALRQSYTEPPGLDDKSSPVAWLYELLSKTIVFPASQWSNLLSVAMKGGLPSEQQVAWLTTAFGAMKCDWNEEVMGNERKELALKAEYLRQEIKQLEGSDLDDQLRKRTDTSSELLQTYSAVRQNLQEAHSHRQEVQQARQHELDLLAEQIQAHVAGLQSFSQSSTEQHKQLEGELNQSQDSIKLQLQHMEEVRQGIDKEIDELDARKRELRIELDEVSRKLDEARMKQKQHMEKVDKQRQEKDAKSSSMKEQIQAAEKEAAKAEGEKVALEQAMQLIRDTDTLLQQTLEEQLGDLAKKQTSFQEHFKSLLLDHLCYAEEQAGKLRTRAEACQEIPERSAIISASSAAVDALDAFQQMYLAQLAPPEADARVQKIRELHQAVRSILGERPEAAESQTATLPAAQPATGNPAGYPAQDQPAAQSAAEGQPAAQPAAEGSAPTVPLI